MARTASCTVEARNASLAGLVLLLAGFTSGAAPAAGQTTFRPDAPITLTFDDGAQERAAPRTRDNVAFIYVRNWADEQRMVRLQCQADQSVSRCSVPVRFVLQPREIRRVHVSYDAGNVGSGAVGVSVIGSPESAVLVPIAISSTIGEASSLSDEPAPTNAPPVVTPDGDPFTAEPNSVGNRAEFLVENPNGVSKTYAITCSAKVGYQCVPDVASIVVPALDARIVMVTLSVTDVGGTFSLKAAHVSDGFDTGSYSVSIRTRNPAPPIVSIAANAADRIARSSCVTSSAGPAAFFQCAELMIPHSMPVFRSLNRNHSLTLIYNSGTALPYPVVMADISIDTATLTPDSIRSTLTLGGASYTYRFTATGLEPGGGSRRIAIGVNAVTAGIVTGIHPYTLEISNYYGATPYATTLTGELIVVNRVNSPYGRGWGVAGVGHLYTNQPNNAILLVEGDGTAVKYAYLGNNRWQAAPGAYRDEIRWGSTQLPNGATQLRYVRTLLDRTQIYYAAGGQQLFVAEPIGAYQRVYAQYRYNQPVGSEIRLRTVVLPVDTTLKYNLTYSNNLLGSVSDPAGRVMTISRPSGEIRFLDPGFAAGQEVIVDQNTSGLATRLRLRIGAADTTGFSYFSTNTTPFLTRIRQPEPGLISITPWVTQGLATSTTNLNATVHSTQAFTTIDGARDPFDAVDVTHFLLNQYGAPVRIDPPETASTHLWYDASAPLRVERMFRQGRILKAEYDALGRILWSEDSTNSSGFSNRTEYAYADPGAPDRPSSIVTPREGAERDETSFTYQAGSGLLLTVVDSRGGTTEFSYNTFGQVDSIIDARDNATRFEYVPGACVDGGEGEPPEAVSPTGSVVAGNLSAIITPQLRRTTFYYDVYGNVCGTELPTGDLQFTDHNAMNWVTSSTEFDVVFGQTGVQELTTTYRQNLNGQDTARIDPRGVERRWRYDWAGRLEEMEDEFDSTQVWQFDPAGNLTRIIYRNGDRTQIRYDAAGRDTLILHESMALLNSGPSWARGDTIHIRRTSTGLPYQVRNKSSWITRSYNVDESIASEWQSLQWKEGAIENNYTYHYTYEANGALSTVTMPSGTVASYNYGPSGALEQLTWPGRTWSFTTDVFGRDSVIEYPNNVLDALYFYSADGQLDSLRMERSPFTGATYSASFAVTQSDAMGRPRSASRSTSFGDAGGPRVYSSWTYSGRGYLLSESGGGLGTRYYQYDGSGNRKVEDGTNVDYTYYYGGDQGTTRLSNRLLRREAVPFANYETSTYTYDANGSVFDDDRRVGTAYGQHFWFRYNVDGQLWSHWADNGDVPEIHYRYDGVGRTVRSRDLIGNLGDNHRVLSYLGNNVGTVDGTANELVQRPGLDQALMMTGYDCYYVLFGTRVEFAVDGMGQIGCDNSTPEVSDTRASGGAFDSHSFAVRRGTADAPSDNVGAASISNFRNRWYDARTGRFIQEDPIGFFGGPNLYGYAGNNPATFTDPFGLCPWCLGAVLGVVEGYAVSRLMGVNYSARDALVDAALGAAGAGLVDDLNDVRRLRRRFAAVADNLSFGRHVSPQLGRRGWTEASARRLVRDPHSTRSMRDTRHLPDGSRMDDPATAYIDRSGDYIIVNDRTHDVIQVSNRNDPNWEAPW